MSLHAAPLPFDADPLGHREMEERMSQQWNFLTLETHVAGKNARVQP